MSDPKTYPVYLDGEGKLCLPLGNTKPNALMVNKEDYDSKLITNQINIDAHNNLIRKLNEANARIVEFEDIKKGHLKVQEDLKKQIDVFIGLKNNLIDKCNIARYYLNAIRDAADQKLILELALVALEKMEKE